MNLMVFGLDVAELQSYRANRVLIPLTDMYKFNKP